MSTYPILKDVPFPPTATDEDILNCFRLILGRYPEPGEWLGHSARVGERLADVVKTYINSLEFHKRGLLTHLDEVRIEQIQLDGFAMYASPDDLAVGKPLLALRDYEPYVSGVFRQRVSSGMQVLDIGANIGFYSLLAASIVGPQGVVWAVEPNPSNVGMILRSRASNNFEHLRVIQAAAHDRWEVLTLFTDQTNGAVAPCATTGQEVVRNTVMGLPVRSMLPEGARVDVVKIDVEGAEGIAMLGMLDVLDRCRPLVFTEFTPSAMPQMSQMSGEEYLKLFTDRHYHLKVLSPDGLIECGADIQAAMREFDNAGLSHMDLLCEPV